MRHVLRHTGKLLLSLAISAALVALLLHLTAGPGNAQLPELPAVLRRTASPGIAAYAALLILGALLRAWRFRLLLAAGTTTPPPPFGLIALVTAVRNMAVDLLPARLGELSYVALLNRGCRVAAERCFSSLSVSFVCDLLALVALIVLLALRQAATGATALPLGALLLGLSIPVALITAAVFGGVRPVARLLRALPARLTAWLHLARLLDFLTRLADAIAAAARSGVLVPVLALSLCVRLTKYTGLFLLYRGVTAASFPDLHAASFTQVMLALIGGEAGASLAIPTFMGFGTYEAGSLIALAWSGFAAAASTLAMLAVHIWSQSVDYLIGGAALIAFLYTARRAPSVRSLSASSSPHMPTDARTKDEDDDKRCPPLALAATLMLLLALASATSIWLLRARAARQAGATQAPPPGAPVAAPPADVVASTQQLTALLHGFVVWCSNRDGNHELYRMDLPGRAMSRLTRNPHVDTMPRLSPDGTRVVFVRSQLPWVSQRNERLWDVYVLDLATGAERLVARSGYSPTWTADGTAVLFERDGSSVVSHTLSTGDERVLFRAADAGLPADTTLQTPSVSAAGDRLATTLRGSRRATAVITHDGTVHRIGGGCQIAWGPGDAYLYDVDHGGRGENAIYRIDPATWRLTPWLDLPGAYSHEYFPRVSPDGQWLVLGAAAEGHEHDTADYEIFLWRIGSPPASAARLTFHTGNDCWPDVWINPTPH
ncbi:MAG: lysylphosphatidylglycerol synthase domain-containing protein [Lentisphaerae bacterium]|nr:lysylphosphatidylglycerol synthase domain-containing protein [Lentisphaerota bacterium]